MVNSIHPIHGNSVNLFHFVTCVEISSDHAIQNLRKIIPNWYFWKNAKKRYFCLKSPEIWMWRWRPFCLVTLASQLPTWVVFNSLCFHPFLCFLLALADQRVQIIEITYTYWMLGIEINATDVLIGNSLFIHIYKNCFHHWTEGMESSSIQRWILETLSRSRGI